MSFTYTTDIPDGPNNPSNDQPDMKINTNSIDSIIAVDHVGFNTPKGGFHKQVKFTANQAAPGFGTGVGDIYANTASGNSWPFWENALGSFQLAGNQTASSNGRVVIPGGIILQWGTGVLDLHHLSKILFFLLHLQIIVLIFKRLLPIAEEFQEGQLA